MKILVFGATGKIGRILVPRLLEAGHAVVAYVRDSEKAKPLREAGAEIYAADLEEPIGTVWDGVDAAVFTAGSGAATGKDKTLTIDLWGAIKTIRSCEWAGVYRYIMVSALRADDPDRSSGGMKSYFAAKHAADEILRASSLQATILRPGRLSDEPASGKIRTGPDLIHEQGEISRANVAEMIVLCLAQPETIGKTYEVLDGDTPIREVLCDTK